MPLHAPHSSMPTYPSQVADVTPILTPTEVDHYQIAAHDRRLRRACRARTWASPHGESQDIVARDQSASQYSRSICAAWCTTMQTSFRSFGFGLFSVGSARLS